jgi:hypothetical protein
MCDNFCGLPFPNKINQLFSPSHLEPSMSFPCSSDPPKENTHGQRIAICAHAEHLFSSISFDFKRITTKSVHKLCNKFFVIVMNVSSTCF